MHHCQPIQQWLDIAGNQTAKTVLHIYDQINLVQQKKQKTTKLCKP